MQLPEVSQGSRILAFGGYQPANVLTNETLAATVETTDEWIRSRVGIESRACWPSTRPSPTWPWPRAVAAKVVHSGRSDGPLPDHSPRW